MQIKWYVWLVSIVSFLFTLYLVELGPWSSSEVGKYNDGYGTFDMKKYNPDIVKDTLSKMKSKGFTQSYHYYISDSIFVIFFGLLQVLISLAVYKKANASKLYLILAILAIAVPLLRGVLDLVENGLLAYTIKSYPNLNTTLITIASVVTQCKLLCIRIWIGLIGAGIVFRFLP